MQFNLVNNTEMLVFLFRMEGLLSCQQSELASSGIRAEVHIGHAAQSSGYLEPRWEERSVLCFLLAVCCLFFSGSAF